jgi:histo-blood group ABO system transferase
MTDKIIGLVVICTGHYDVFLQPLIDSADKYFMGGHEVDFYLFSDKDYPLDMPEGIALHQMSVPMLPFPFPTLYRYKWMTQYADRLTAKNLFYIDVDMLFVDKVGEEILPQADELVTVYSPGFNNEINGGWADTLTPPESTAWLPKELRHGYYAGGFQGGSRDAYLMAASVLDKNIDIDLETAQRIGFTQNSGVMAQYHDESHWNHYLKYHPFRVLNNEYCMVESMKLRKTWEIEHLKPRIISLDKDHEKIRNINN